MDATAFFESKVKSLKNGTLLETLNQPKLKKHLPDWRNWTEPMFRAIANEAYNRGLIEN